MLDEIMNSPHADALVSAAATFAVAVAGAVWARLSKRWAFLVPVKSIARDLIRAAVLETERDVATMKRASGRDKLDAIQAGNARMRAIERAEEKANRKHKVSLRRTIGDRALRQLVETAVRESKPAGGD